jgi:adenylosuccinate lyase
MPQKRNPKFANEAIIASARARAMVPLALETLIQSHEVDGSRSATLDHALAEACTQMFDALLSIDDLLAGLQVFPERMRANLELSSGLISAEAVMMALGRELGRQQAHELVHDVALAASRGSGGFLELLLLDDRASRHLNRERLEFLLEPTNYLGLSADIARDASSRARMYLSATDRR